MWQTATETDAFRAAIVGATSYHRDIVRLFGIPESEIANTLRAAEADGLALDPLEITTCLRRGEIEIATRYEPDAQADYDRLLAFIRDRHGDTLFSLDGSTIDDQVAELLAGHTLAVAESCTGGLLAARLTDRAGSSAYFLGGGVVYSNQAKTDLAGVDPALIERVGAVSMEVGEALAEGIAARFSADIGVGITGIAGPGGGTEEKPVGLVYISVCDQSGCRPADHPPHRDARRPRRHPRSVGDGRAASAAAAAAGRGRRRSRQAADGGEVPGVAGVRLFVALDLPASVRQALTRWAAGAFGGVPGVRLLARRVRCTSRCAFWARSTLPRFPRWRAPVRWRKVAARYCCGWARRCGCRECGRGSGPCRWSPGATGAASPERSKRRCPARWPPAAGTAPTGGPSWPT